MMITPIQLDYGAEGAIWYSPFNSENDLIKFWENVPFANYINPTDLTHIFTLGKLEYFNHRTNEKYRDFQESLYFSSRIKIIIIDDYTSILKIDKKPYYHKGFLGEKKYTNL